MVFFENFRCLKCDHTLGFLPDALELKALDTAGKNRSHASLATEGSRRYKFCTNARQFEACNWMIDADDPNEFCIACRFNEVIPNLSIDKNLVRWKKIELAKRRCIYTFLRLGLSLHGSQSSDPSSLRFRFLQDVENATVQTGHEKGVITINIAEADQDELEHRRLSLHEPYRTLVGHFRHETGHFFWDQLIRHSPDLQGFRDLFGDETVDYDLALRSYYKNGPPANWADHGITAYASSHPWEDWAETWAHYLHIMDTLETAASFGVNITRDSSSNYSADNPLPVVFGRTRKFEDLLSEWVPLTCALNAINRGMGLSDLYPFVIPIPVVDKLRFIHNLVAKHANSVSNRASEVLQAAV
jgi:hypothetical protein